MDDDVFGSDDSAEVIAAKAAAKVQILEARAKLSPTAQTVYAVFDSIGWLVSIVGLIVIVIIIALLFFGRL